MELGFSDAYGSTRLVTTQEVLPTMATRSMLDGLGTDKAQTLQFRTPTAVTIASLIEKGTCTART